MQEKMLKNKKGITLIALIITIIVMLILVAITISVALNGGLFEYAGKAAVDTQNAINKEQEYANLTTGQDYQQLIDKYTRDETGSDVLTANQEYTDSNGAKAVIPKGFKLTSEKTIETGLVIEDAIGNQFVWIPVTVTGSSKEEKEASFDAIRTKKNDSNFVEPASGDETEYNAMRTSIINNGGFYIARYEAGCSIGRISTDSSVAMTPLSKKGVYPYNMVNWSDAKTASQNMYNDSTKYGVKSTLCYGVEWDAMLSFLGKTNETDSTSWGNYYNAGPFDFTGKYYQIVWDDNGENILSEGWNSNTTTKTKDTEMLLQTGASDRNSLKNIYDVAGNVVEWTMEANFTSNRVSRGGNFGFDGGYYDPASYRYRNFPTDSYNDLGFRVALYL